MTTLTRRLTVTFQDKPEQRLRIILGGLGCLLFMAGALSVTVGALSLDLAQILSGSLTEFDQSVLFSIRLPRILLAATVGAALGISGAAMQGLFRNPLADPALIGITGGAALAVACVIVLAGTVSGYLGLYGLGIAAFVGGIASSMVIMRIARFSGTFSVTHMLLAGIAINAVTFAGTGFLTFLSDDQQLRALSFWTMGSLGGALWEPVLVCLTIVIPCLFVLIRKSRDLNLLLLGEENATYAGLDTHRLKRAIVITASLCVGAAVAVSGIIGFIGLVVPHLIRLLFGSDHKLLIPASALFGASLLVLADTVARTVVAPTEMPVGILTSLVGGPFFLWLLVKQSRLKP
ncbi:FecCD family ABC transporter permease [Sneathiella chinensis]|uniref:Hemin transport system permease protein HmuU n=1 Tax=Sneathiella chinensis TaxID=349750 RepID=A0ABQ5U0E0_9PROT|nr:iron ABC transporter permease [Sneathiella chinensis]GLQ04788.1 hemin transport system permease protein HmuU [Sneathiella chinensis]